MVDTASPTLRCLEGRACPEDVAVHARSAHKLTATAFEHMPEVLEACVVEAMTQKLATALTQLSVRWEIAEADLGRTIRACRFLVREAAAVDLPREVFVEDFRQLFGEVPALERLLVGSYDGLKKKVRTQLYSAALEEHGAVLSDVAWRLDLVAQTSHAPKLMMPVALLTLSYRQNGTDQRLTLQVTGDGMAKLRGVAEAVLK